MTTIKLYKDDHQRGSWISLDANCPNLSHAAGPSFSDINFNNTVSSLQVLGGSWDIYKDENYSSPAMRVTPTGGDNHDGIYDTEDLRGLGLPNDNISSLKMVQA